MPGGRPLKFKSVEELQAKINAYFDITDQKRQTITGLALALDTSRETLMNYEEKEEYFDTIKKAKEMVHNAYELDLREKGRSGDIFALKNFGWSDKQEVDHTTKGESINNSDEVKRLTEQLNALHRENGESSHGGATGSLGEEVRNKE